MSYLALPASKMWTIKASSSSSLQIIIPKKEMKAKDFMAQIASLFKLRMGYFVVIYSLPLSPETEIEIDINDNDRFESAYRFLPAFSKLKVLMKRNFRFGYFLII